VAGYVDLPISRLCAQYQAIATNGFKLVALIDKADVTPRIRESHSHVAADSSRAINA
jgi:hypothetical protein